MPAIYLFQRRTLFGGDDLQPAAWVTITFRIIQLIFLLGPICTHWFQERNQYDEYYYHQHYNVLYDPAIRSVAAAGVDYPQGDNYDENDTTTSSSSCQHSHLFVLLLLLYIISSALYGIGSIVLEWRIASWSSIGSPTTDTEPRSTKVSHLLEIKLFPLSIVLFVIFVLGLSTIAYSPIYYHCRNNLDSNNKINNINHEIMTTTRITATWLDHAVAALSEHNNNNKKTPAPTTTVDDEWDIDHVILQQVVKHTSTTSSFLLLSSLVSSSLFVFQLWWIAFGILLVSQFMEFIFAWSYLLHLFHQPVFVPIPAIIISSEDDEHPLTTTTTTTTASILNNHELIEEMWAERCSSACQCLSATSCFVFGGRELAGQAEFGDIARALTDYLETGGILDVVPSDFVVGFVLLQRIQQHRIYETRQREVLLFRQAEEEDQENNKNNDNISIPLSLSSSSILCDHGGEKPLSCIRQPPRLNKDEMMMVPLDCNSRVIGDILGGGSGRTTPYRSIEWHNTHDSNNLENEHPRRIPLNRNNIVDMNALEEGAHYAKYALAIYTWVLYLYVHPISGPSRLLAEAAWNCLCRYRCLQDNNNINNYNESFTSPLQQQQSCTPSMINTRLLDEQGRIYGDNICHTHRSALLLTVGLEDSDLIYAQLRSGFSQNPYCILVDHEWESVVVSIRGTFSVEDCVTDVLIEPESLESLGRDFGFDGENQYCHGGVLQCVRNIYADLIRHQLLDQLLLGDQARYRHYTLRLVGHSLGAAACTLLSYMLRPRFPRLRCVNYSPPGCSLTWELATSCHDWCTSFVLDSDLVPRLSFSSMERLRDEILTLIGRIKVPKIEVARRLVHPSYVLGCRLCWDMDFNDYEKLGHILQELLYNADEIPNSDYSSQFQRFRVIQERRRQSRGTRRSIQLFPAGKIVHLAKTGEKRSCIHGFAKCITCCTTSFGFHYMPVWVNNDDLNEIVVSPTMGTDHFPNRIQSALETVAIDFGLVVS